jgi:hypothetical protein
VSIIKNIHLIGNAADRPTAAATNALRQLDEQERPQGQQDRQGVPVRALPSVQRLAHGRRSGFRPGQDHVAPEGRREALQRGLAGVADGDRHVVTVALATPVRARADDTNRPLSIEEAGQPRDLGQRDLQGHASSEVTHAPEGSA